MLKHLISYKKDTIDTYIQSCGAPKILNITYYKSSFKNEEDAEVCITYFGYIEEEHRGLAVCSISLEAFLKFYQELKTCIYVPDKYSSTVECGSFILGFSRLDSKYVNIRLTKNNKMLIKNKCVWEISIRNSELKEYLNELEKLKDIILEENLNVKASNLQ